MIVAQNHLNPMDLHRHTKSYPHGLSTVYAIPARRPYGKSGATGTEGLTYIEHELLRSRKTPYGRIDERFEENSIDHNVYGPASKHVLLSAPPQSSSTQRNHLNLQQDFEGQTGKLSSANSYIHEPIAKHSTTQTVTNILRSPGWLDGSVDSALQQPTTVQDQRYYYHPGSQIPTVLPATLHAQLGPTASAGQQYFGPYWPDGTFSPYRPAPVRDSRFSERDLEWTPSHPAPTPDGRTLRRLGRLPAAHSIDVGVDNIDRYVSPYKPADGHLPFYERVLGSSVNGHVAHDSVNNNADFGNLAQDQFPSHSLLTQSSDLTHRQNWLRPNEASDRIAFRDRTFSWAHQVYVDLLAKIQRENKLGRPMLNASGVPKVAVKPSIFPKPPQRIGSCFNELPIPLDKAYVKHSDKRLDRSRKEDGRPQTAIQSPQRRVTGHDDHILPTNPQRANSLQTHLQQTAFSNSHHVSDPSIHSVTNHPPSTSPPFAAISALETMEILCEEAHIPWTDGMLLAGCLAYGLGNYNKAVVWYQKVLQQDPTHVEAMSNLAATLLALGKREEALSYWSAAVRLRPSYFEAVEHLIGLLCAAHRAKDAVEIIEHVESQLKLPNNPELSVNQDIVSDGDDDNHSQASSIVTIGEHGVFDFDIERRASLSSVTTNHPALGFGSSGYSIPGADNGRLLALIHAKGNMLYGLGDNSGAAAAFEDAILVATGHRHSGIRGLIQRILHSCVSHVDQYPPSILHHDSKEPILLSPERAQQTVQRMFPPTGILPGLEFVHRGLAHRAAVSTTSNSLLSLAKIYQDGMGNANVKLGRKANGTREILALYYLSLSLQRSPSTANNVGILLASVQQTANIHVVPQCNNNQIFNYSGIAPGSGIALALQYYNYGLNIDPNHAHLYTNLGSLLKDLGQLTSAIRMYQIAVQCDGSFDIALANLANAVKDQGRIADAIGYYRRAVQANPDFAEAVCGLATALNSVCNWYGRGGVYADDGSRDRIHVDEHGKMHMARKGCGWMNRVVEIVDKQLVDGESWGMGTLTSAVIDQICSQLMTGKVHLTSEAQQQFHQLLQTSLRDWAGKRWEGLRIVRLIERAIRHIGWQWYQDQYIKLKDYPLRRYARPLLPASLSSPTAPTVLPFHTFTTPLSAKQVRQISQRNALRISVSALRSSWLPLTVYPPPPPPFPCLNVGYVSSDFNNHPLAHLMQSVFGLHDQTRVRAFCYATTSSDGSVHRQQIEREVPVFYDASAWNVEKLVNQIVKDRIHILVNLNGYTRGAKNEVFAVRPAPIHMSFMGFAGTLGAEWCDYVYADSISVLPKTLAPWRRNVDIEDRLHPDALVEDQEDWMYAENVIFTKSTFFCVDHKQSAPDVEKGPPNMYDRAARDAAWRAEQDKRWRLRRELFPMLSDTAVILGNFNQLYKIDPSTFRMYLRILAEVPNAILWLLRFPDVGEQNLKNFALEWAGKDVADRVLFTDVAPKGAHITRASVVDLFLDTPECNAHTTAADVIWSGTPIVTWARWDYKMCSRMASSIVASAFPDGPQGDEARADLLVTSDEQYEKQAICLASGLRYPGGGSSPGKGRGRLMDLRRMLWEGRWTSRLFDTKRWVRDVENAYWEAWRKWERGEGGDIWL